MQSPESMTALCAVTAIEHGALTCEALARACLARIAAREPIVHAWRELDAQRMLVRARDLDRGPRVGLLHGLPVAIKDIISTADFPTRYGSSIYADHHPPAHAACVSLIEGQGAIIPGKTVTTEFAYFQPGPTTNPVNPSHTPGGSSSGSAAAVADFMVPLALGTQTGGSVIRPAAYCGVYACKPSFGSINRGGMKFDAESLDTIGVFGRSVEDVALALEPLTGRASPKFQSVGNGPRIGLCRTPRWNDADAATQANLEAAARALSKAGARVHDFELPPGSDTLFDRHKVIMGYENARALAWEYFNHPDKISADLKPRLDEGWQVSRAD